MESANSSSPDHPLRPLIFAMVVGEASGDNLGLSLMRALKARFPNARFEGIGGPQMIAEGFKSLFPMERLAVMGLVEPLKRLPELLHIRQTLTQRYLKGAADCFIGIDAPDFNLELERRLKAKGLPVIHYVSPSVWAWRKKRVYKVADACHLLLTLFPFEAPYYQDTDLKICCVGHTLADERDLAPSQQDARKQLASIVEESENLVASKKILAVLPGSRMTEVEKIAPVFIRAAQALMNQRDEFCVVIPAANPSIAKKVEQLIKQINNGHKDARFMIVSGHAQQVLEAADLVLISSGTATLEAMLAKKPMVIGYRVAFTTFQIARWLVNLTHVGLPNLLAGKELVPEFIQDDLTAEAVLAALEKWIQQPKRVEQLKQSFLAIHQSLRLNAGETGAQAIAALLYEHESTRNRFVVSS